MTDRSLVYGMLHDLTQDGVDDIFLEDVGHLLWRVGEELPPLDLNEASVVVHAARNFLPRTKTMTAAHAAIRALIAASALSSESMETLQQSIASAPSHALLEAIGMFTKELSKHPDVVVLAGVKTFAFVDNDENSPLSAARDSYVRAVQGLLAARHPAAVDLAAAIMSHAALSQGTSSVALAALPSQSFSYRGGAASLVEDGSGEWSEHVAEDARRVATALANAAIEDETIAARCRRPLAALFWAELLQRAAQSSEIQALRFTELLEALPLLSCDDTRVEAGALLEFARPRLAPAALNRIATVIEAIEDNEIASAFAAIIPDVHSHRLDELRAVGGDRRPALNHRRRHHSVGFIGLPDDWWTRRNGADPAAPANILLQELERPVKSFESAAAAGDTLEAAPVVAAMRDIENLYASLLQRSGASTATERQAADSLASAIEGALRCEVLPPAILERFRTMLLWVARHPMPSATERGHTAGSWGRPAPRIAAASAVMILAMRLGDVDTPLRSTMEALSTDPVEAVRYQILVRSNLLFNVDRELMWTLLDRWAGSELGGLTHLVGPVSRVFRTEPTRTAALLAKLWRRVELPDTADVRAELAPVVAALAFNAKEQVAIELLNEIFADAGTSPKSLQRILADFRSAKMWLHEDADRRRSSLGFLRRVADTAAKLIASDEAKSLAAGADLIEAIVSQVMFSLQDAGGKARVDKSVQLRFLQEADDILQTTAKYQLDAFHTHMMTRLLALWLAARPERAVIAASAFSQRQPALREWWNARDLVEAVMRLDERELKEKDSRDAFVRVAGRLAPFAGNDEGALLTKAALLAKRSQA